MAFSNNEYDHTFKMSEDSMISSNNFSGGGKRTNTRIARRNRKMQGSVQEREIENILFHGEVK